MGRPKKLPEGMWQRGGSYYARFRSGGQLVRKKLSTNLEAAKVILNDLRARADKRDFNIIDNDYSWEDLKDEFLRWARQSVRNPQDLQRDVNRIESFRRVTSVKQISHAYVIAYREWRLSQCKISTAKEGKKRATDRTVSPRTVNREVGTLQNMLNKGVEWGKVGSNPIAGLKPLEQGDARKQRRSLSAEEVEAIMEAAPAYLIPVLRLFTVAAIRRTELVELLFSDVDFERRCIAIRASIAKNKRAREIHLDDDTLAMIVELRDAAPARMPTAGNSKAFSREHVFVTAENTPHRNNLLRSFYVVCKRAGIEGGHQGGSIDLHSLRVTSASLMLENGASPKAVQSILGHSTLALTMNVYAKATERAKRDAVSCLPFVKHVSPPDGVVSFQGAHTVSTANSEATKNAENRGVSRAV